MGLSDGHRSKPLVVRLLKRGELSHPGDPVEPGLPAELAGGPGLDGVPREKWRTVLAGWVANPKNPLRSNSHAISVPHPKRQITSDTQH